MEKCKFCQADLAENGTFCPSCGRNNAEDVLAEAVAETEAAAETEAVVEAEPAAEEAAPVEAPKKPSAGKTALIVAAVVVLAALLIALVLGGQKTEPQEAAPGSLDSLETVPELQAETVPATIPPDGNPEDVTAKGTYTVADDAALADKDMVVAAMGDKTLTNAVLRVYYRNAISSFLSTEYGYYMMAYGMMDPYSPLETQISYENENQTWQQYFLQVALDNWQMTQGMALEAEAAGMQISAEEQEYLDGMRESLETMAQENDTTVENMVYENFGAGVDFEDFAVYQALISQGNPYYEAESAKLVATEQQLEEYFKANEETYAANGVTMDSRYVDVRHILVQVKGGTAAEDGTTTYTDEEWAACEAAAQEILDAWLAGDKTEDSFAALANEKSEDPGSNTVGGLYENVYQGQMVEPFEAWCFDESRQHGDYGLVKTSYGYHVMFYVDSRPMWKSYAESGWFNEQVGELLNSVAEKHPAEVNYALITLGDIAMG